VAYDIYDVETANLVRSFPTEAAALTMVRRIVKRDGPESVEAWAMGRTDLTGDVIAVPGLVHVPHQRQVKRFHVARVRIRRRQR